MAKYAKKVYGIEIVKEAVDAAKENAIINNVNNLNIPVTYEIDSMNLLNDILKRG